MYQMKEQYKTPEEQLSEVEIGNLSKKVIQSNDGKDEPRSLKKNGDTD